MTFRTSSGERVVLFTLVDLLLQMIFLAFFLFAANRATQGEMQDKVGALARKFGVVSVTRYLNATSKLVAIADLGRVDVIPAGEKQTRALDDTTTLLQNLDRRSLAALAGLNGAELKAFAGVYADLSGPERRR